MLQGRGQLPVVINRWLARRAGRVVAVGLLSLLSFACSSTVHQADLPRGTLRVTTRTGEARLDVELATNGRARTIGLMNRPKLDPNAGMVFVFDGPHVGGFWMKDTLIPLSIAFWDGSGRILKILHMTPCQADPCPVYNPEVTYVGAVEANRGWFDAHGVQLGDRVTLTRN
jgi:uncharacterized membrane protein (UPF0127 family)